MTLLPKNFIKKRRGGSLTSHKIISIILLFAIISVGVLSPIAAPSSYAEESPSLPDTPSCGITNLTGCLAWVVVMIQWIISQTTTLAGLFLEKSIQYSVNEFGSLANSSLVQTGWVIVRDLSNLIFIFLILWVAISTILGLGSGSPMKSVMRIAIAALLINFSLFITKAVIDVANIVALHFYYLITAGESGSFGGVFMNGLALQTLYNPAAVSGLLGNLEMMYKIILTGVFGSILLLVAAWVFFAGAVMFMIRSIYLVILMMLSPLAFIAWVIPGMAGITKQWWDKLFKQAFFAPAFMVIAYIAGKYIQSLPAQGTYTNTIDTITGANGAVSATQAIGVMGIFTNFFVVIGLLVAALLAGSKMGAVGSTTMMSWGNKIRGAGQSWVGGRTVGMAARWADERLSHTRFGNRGYGKTIREWTTGALKDTKWGGSMSAEERHKEDLELATKRHEIALEKGHGEEKGMVQIADEIHQTEQNILAEKAKGGQADQAKITSLQEKSNDLRNEIQALINMMSPHAIAEMDKNTLRNRYVMEYMTTSGINAIKQNDKRLTEEERREFVGAWLANLKDNINNYKNSTEEYEKKERDLRKQLATGTLTVSAGRPAGTTPEKEMEIQLEDLAKEIRSRGGILDMMRDARGLYDRIREMNTRALETAHWADPGLFKNRYFVSTVRYGEIQNLRKSEELTSGEKEDTIRIAKDFSAVKAMDDIDGLGLDAPDDDRIKAWKEALEKLGKVDVSQLSDDEKKAHKDAAEAYEALIKVGTDLIKTIPDVATREHEWEERKAQTLRGTIKNLSLGAQEVYKAHFTPLLKSFHQFGEDKMNDWQNGRSLTEIGYAKGSIRTRTGYMDRLSQAELNTGQWRERDTGDKAPIVQHLIEAYALEQKAIATGGSYRMTDANRKAFRWLITTPPDKQTFFNAYDAIAEDKNVQNKLNQILVIARGDANLKNGVIPPQPGQNPPQNQPPGQNPTIQPPPSGTTPLRVVPRTPPPPTP